MLIYHSFDKLEEVKFLLGDYAMEYYLKMKFTPWVQGRKSPKIETPKEPLFFWKPQRGIEAAAVRTCYFHNTMLLSLTITFKK